MSGVNKQIFTGTEIASDTMVGVADFHSATRLDAQIEVTAASGSTPTLDVKLQDSLDGTNWTDVTSGAFTQATTTTIERITVATFDGAFVRIAWTITGGTPSFTFNVRVIGKCQ